eukprot:2830768-Rhodomonas_salina.1
MYSWRGVKDEFVKTVAGREFHLTNSFRFGEAIVKVATLILRHSNSEVTVCGVAKESREVTQVPGAATEMAVV